MKLVPSLHSTTQFRLLMIQEKMPFETNAGKGANAGSQHFFHLAQCFLSF